MVEASGEPTTPVISFDFGEALPLFQGVQHFASDFTRVPDRRIQLGDYPTAATLRVHSVVLEPILTEGEAGDETAPRELVGPTLFSSQGSWVQRCLYPFNRDIPVDAMPEGNGTFIDVVVEVLWDDDSGRLYEIEDGIEERLGDEAFDTDGDYSDRFYEELSSVKADLHFMDEDRARVQPIVLKAPGMLMVASIPDSVTWDINQGGVAEYGQFFGGGMTRFLQPSSPNTPELPEGTGGASLALPLDSKVLGSITLEFVLPSVAAELLSPRA